MRIKETNPEDVFGDLTRKTIWSNNPLLNVGDVVTITNSNCELEYDCIEREFRKGLIYGFICELDLLNVDLSEYLPGESNSGGRYAYAECRVKKIIERGY